SSIALLETYAARYKGTYYADPARTRIDELKTQQVATASPPAQQSPATQVQPAAAVTPGRCDGIEIPVGQSERRCFKPGAGKTQHFQDCETCPEMVIVPAGQVTMGSPTNEPERDEDEGQLQVTIAKAFAVGRFAVTRGEFATFVAATNHKSHGGC